MHRTFKLDLTLSFEEVRNFYLSHLDPEMRKRKGSRELWGDFEIVRRENEEVIWEKIRKSREWMLSQGSDNHCLDAVVLDCSEKIPKFKWAYDKPGEFLVANRNFPFRGYMPAGVWPLLCFGMQYQKGYFQSLGKEESKWLVSVEKYTHYTKRYCIACRKPCWDEADGWYPGVSTGEIPNLDWGYCMGRTLEGISRILIIKLNV